MFCQDKSALVVRRQVSKVTFTVARHQPDQTAQSRSHQQYLFTSKTCYNKSTINGGTYSSFFFYVRCNFPPHRLTTKGNAYGDTSDSNIIIFVSLCISLVQVSMGVVTSITPAGKILCSRESTGTMFIKGRWINTWSPPYIKPQYNVGIVFCL